MLEQFFECEDNREMFRDYSARQIWAKDMLYNCKFVWAETDVRSHTDFRVCCSVSLTRTVTPSPGQAEGLDARSLHPTSICNTPQQYHWCGGYAQPRGHFAGHRLGRLWVCLSCCEVPTEGGIGSGYRSCMYNLTQPFHTNNSFSG